MHRPRKRFGQHFLHDPAIIRRIAEAVDPSPDDHVIEIGPGQGALTEALLPRVKRLDAIEIDRDLAASLEQRFSASPGLEVHCADALALALGALGETPMRVVGNLPYNISTPLIFHLLDQIALVRDMHFMLQREVVRRLCAAPGEADYGRLGVMVSYYCRCQRLFGVGPGAFQPPPKVSSDVVRLVPHAEPPVSVSDPRLLSEVVARAFGQRRKTLRNALKPLLSSEAIAAAGVDPGERAERLSLADFAALTEAATRAT